MNTTATIIPATAGIKLIRNDDDNQKLLIREEVCAWHVCHDNEEITAHAFPVTFGDYDDPVGVRYADGSVVLYHWATAFVDLVEAEQAYYSDNK